MSMGRAARPGARRGRRDDRRRGGICAARSTTTTPHRATTRRPLGSCAHANSAEACAELADERTSRSTSYAPAGATTSELSTFTDARDLGYDGWLTFASNAEIVRDARARCRAPAGRRRADGTRSPARRWCFAGDRTGLRRLREHCGGEVTYQCIGDVAGRPWSSIGGEAAWGAVKIGHDDPASSGTGLAVIGQAAARFFGRTDLSRDDFEDDAFLEWFTRLERSVPSNAGSGQTPFERLLVSGPAALDLVITTEAEVARLLPQASRDRRKNVTLLYPAPVAPVACADIVFAPIRGASGADDLRDAVTGDDGRGALREIRVARRRRAPGRIRGCAEPRRAPSNLPDAGALVALLQMWRDVTR